MVMLGAVAVAVTMTGGQWLAAFAVAFGIWDISFYAFLKLLLNWPDSLWTLDILFLIPVPWTGPVIAPMLVSATMIIAGIAYLWREWHGRPVYAKRYDWAGVVLGGLVLVIAFVGIFRTLRQAANLILSIGRCLLREKLLGWPLPACTPADAATHMTPGPPTKIPRSGEMPGSCCSSCYVASHCSRRDPVPASGSPRQLPSGMGLERSCGGDQCAGLSTVHLPRS